MAWYDESQFLLKVFVSVLRIPVVGEVLWLFDFPHWLALKSRKVNFTIHLLTPIDSIEQNLRTLRGGFVFLFPTSGWRALRDLGGQKKQNKITNRRKKIWKINAFFYFPWMACLAWLGLSAGWLCWTSLQLGFHQWGSYLHTINWEFGRLGFFRW